MLVDKTNSGFEIYRARENRYKQDPIVQDLGGNGNFELVVDLTYLGECCACLDVIFPAIYEWTGLGYEYVSERFPAFYRKKLAELQLQIDSARNTNMVSERIIEAAKIKRFLGISPDAGLDYAITLAKSRDFRDRELAARILYDVPGPRAENYLRALSHDPEVSQTAARMLDAPKFHPPDTLPVRVVLFKDLAPADSPE